MIVCATTNLGKKKQEGARGKNPLPNKTPRQQVYAPLLGYACVVSKADDQDNTTQVRALRAGGCQKVFEETASGSSWNRPELHHLLDQIREGDTLVVWKLDRLSRSLKDLLHILEKIDTAGATSAPSPKPSTLQVLPNAR